MRKCRHYDVCGLEADPMLDTCILHSTDPAKNQARFDAALDQYRKTHGSYFRLFVFPGRFDLQGSIDEAAFIEVTFNENAYFSSVKFTGETAFRGVIFKKIAFFSFASFSSRTEFRCVFGGEADFSHAEFQDEAHFGDSAFRERAIFDDTKFLGGAFFQNVKFQNGGSFRDSAFAGKHGSTFQGSAFLGSTIFSAARYDLEKAPIFGDQEIDFSEVTIAPLDAVTFRYADFRTCEFSGLDLRNVEVTSVVWPRIKGRIAVYDEIDLLETGLLTRRFSDKRLIFSAIERLYRQLKQNYEGRSDYEREGDFHYGEMEMRRRNSETSHTLRFFLTAYWLLSGYGERYLRPAFWAAVLLLSSAFLYLFLGIHPKNVNNWYSLRSLTDWGRAVHYSFRVMTLLKPEDLVVSESAQVVNTIETIAGPVVLGLFALAVRQHLKR